MKANLELNFNAEEIKTDTQQEYEYSVSEISKSIKSLMEGNFFNIRVRGEISGLKSAGSGHLYFSLKDSSAVLRAICWKGTASHLDFKLEEGLEVVATGKISTYEGQSNYQLIIQKIEAAGQGALLALLEKRKAQLAQEGLFDASKKRPIPFMPQVIGVITAATGAVIRDILHRIEDRMGTKVLLWSVLVQGTEAAKQISDAIVGFNNMPEHLLAPDVIIVARGGGSIEDLWAFNEEVVVRATAASRIPIISAVGHETDTTLIDYASDKRAPTPTAAAEMATPVKADLISNLEIQQSRLRMGLLNNLKHNEARFLKASEILLGFSQKLADVEHRLENYMRAMERALHDIVSLRYNRLHHIAGRLSSLQLNKHLEVLAMRLHNSAVTLHKELEKGMSEKVSLLLGYGRLLESYSYQGVLLRGFALVTASDGSIVRHAKDCTTGADLNIEIHDGTIAAKVQ
jgi:exodeoxyribonuclease VII large subunit